MPISYNLVRNILPDFSRFSISSTPHEALRLPVVGSAIYDDLLSTNRETIPYPERATSCAILALGVGQPSVLLLSQSHAGREWDWHTCSYLAIDKKRNWQLR